MKETCLGGNVEAEAGAEETIREDVGRRFLRFSRSYRTSPQLVIPHREARKG